VLAHHHQRIGALELGHRGTHRLEQVLERLQVVVDTVSDDLRVGLGGEAVAAALEVGAQLIVVLDDAVVDDGESVTGDMRMRVTLARHAMSRPAGMGDADLARGRCVFQGIVEHPHLADGAQPRQVLRAVEHGKTGRIVAAVLEPPQTLHKDRHDVAPGHRSDDSAHDPCLYSAGLVFRSRAAKFA